MANNETQQIDAILASRRAMLRGGLALGGAAVAGLAMASLTPKADAQATTLTDNDILNFALNLEYLEANFYTLATTGNTIEASGIGIGAGTTASGSATVTVKPAGKLACKVPFTMPLVQAYALEVAGQERTHVTTLRSALGSNAVAEPNLDLYNSFIALGNAIGVSNFDPFANDLAFLLGSYIFEDVGVSAYHGAAGSISNKATVLATAAGIHAVEAYHAGLIRTTIFGLDQNATALGAAGTLQTLTQKISTVRATFDGTASTTPDDVGIKVTTVPLEGGSFQAATIVDADSNYQGWARTPSQVLRIVYATASTGVSSGGFFPAGMNGTIKTT